MITQPTASLSWLRIALSFGRSWVRISVCAFLSLLLFSVQFMWPRDPLFLYSPLHGHAVGGQQSQPPHLLRGVVA